MQPSYENPSKELANRYERVVEEENVLFDRIRTVEGALNALLGFLYKHVKESHLLTLEDIVTAVFAMITD